MKTNLISWKLLYERYHHQDFYVLSHTIDGYCKSLFQATLARYQDYLQDTLPSRFRNEREISRSLFGLDAYYSGHGNLKLIDSPGFWKNISINPAVIPGNAIAARKTVKPDGKFGDSIRMSFVSMPMPIAPRKTRKPCASSISNYSRQRLLLSCRKNRARENRCHIAAARTLDSLLRIKRQGIFMKMNAAAKVIFSFNWSRFMHLPASFRMLYTAYPSGVWQLP